MYRKSVFFKLITPIFISAWLMISVGSPSQKVSASTHENALFRVYLTFEDGPTDAYTPQILDILAQYNAKATFFVNGYQIAGREYILQRIVREGHAIGNHLWEEEGHYAGYPSEDIYASYIQTEEAIRNAVGSELARYDAQTKMYRQPGGGGTPFPALGGEQVITYNWNVSGNDCGSNINFESEVSFDDQVIRNMLGEPNPDPISYFNIYEHGDGVVVVLHDINRVTGRVLPEVLDELSAAGATFEALPRSWDSVGTMPVVLGAPPYGSEGVEGSSIVGYTQGTIRIRTAPSLEADTLIGNIPPETALTLIGRTEGWYQVSYEGQIGWAHMGYVRAVGPIPSLPRIGT